MKGFNTILIKIADFLCRPFYTYFCVFPFSIKVGKYPVYKQIQYLHFKLTRKYRTVSEITELKRNNNHCKIEIIPGRDFHQIHLFMTGYYEKSVSNSILRDLSSSNVFIDVGAYLGYYSLIASASFSNIQVYAFEPQKDANERLQKNIKINNFKNIEVYDCALADVNETRQLNINEFPEQTSLHNSALQSGQHYNVQVKRLDDLLDFKSKKVVVKIDTEGYEIEVVKGMSELIENNECTIYFEYNPQIYFQNFGKDYISSFFEFINLKGYKMFDVESKEKTTEYFYNPLNSGQRNLVIKKITGECKLV